MIFVNCALLLVTSVAAHRLTIRKDDIVLSTQQLKIIQTRSAIPVVKPWPNKTIPYRINVGFTESEKRRIRTVMKHIEEISCVQFTENLTYKGYLSIIKSDHSCFSTVGYEPSPLAMRVDPYDCGDRSDILHLFLHALGFFHMTSRPDRDEFVAIQWKNIADYAAFMKLSEEEMPSYDTPYDYLSIMHPHKKVLSQNFGTTVETTDAEVSDKIGTGETLSEGDVLRLNAMYEC
ncbi:low choriolytic enzyme-like [Phlebotomus argentipes]|uniref:low choriolytic enzyme-like n=1 Tax=Phlebotomus argentipes TaxID=94469 RepID=UPI002892C804|nr:low choriolytic enzyme-like [Phlebotomus argentipes]